MVKGKNKGMTYEAAWKEGNVTHEALVDAQGKLLVEEHDVMKSDLPKAVRKTVQEKLPKVGKRQYEMQTAKGVITYEASVMKDGKEIELKLTQDGKVIKKDVSAKDADNEDAEDADHEDADHEDADHEDADHEDAEHEDAEHEDAEHEDEEHEDKEGK